MMKFYMIMCLLCTLSLLLSTKQIDNIILTSFCYAVVMRPLPSLIAHRHNNKMLAHPKSIEKTIQTISTSICTHYFQWSVALR